MQIERSLLAAVGAYDRIIVHTMSTYYELYNVIIFLSELSCYGKENDVVKIVY